MARKFPDYPKEGPWAETTVRMPRFMAEALRDEAVPRHVEVWVWLLDRLRQLDAVPKPPPPPDAVRFRYGAVLREDGTLEPLRDDPGPPPRRRR